MYPPCLPPAKPQFPALAIQNLTIVNNAGVIALRLTASADPGACTVIRMCPAPVASVSDITALYQAKYGLPAVGTKVFLQGNQFIDGHQSIPTVFSALVPAQT
jgi:hypothetical protein